MRITLLITFIVCFFLDRLNAQTLTPNQTANQLVNTLVGDGVSFSNATLICANNASGKFNNTITTPLQMDSGIVLTTGTVLDVLQNPIIFSDLNNLSNNPDADLQAAATGAIYNLCKLEFDFVPIGDTIQFKYIFGSEEYTNYTCSSFNDIFSFFINGPGFPTPTNLALIPGTNCPVSINTVNGSTANPCGNVGSPCAPPNNALFTNNSFGTSIVYDGITKKLTAKAAVTPCSTYHMKFAIADVFDQVLDSGVFLEANSFKSDAAYISLITNSNSLPSPIPFSIEGCNAATVTLKRPLPKSYPQPVAIVLGGTATNGIDVTTIPSVITIPANDTVVTFSINAIEDYIVEGTENLTLYVYGSACNAIVTDSVTIAIQEFPSYTVSDSVFICQGQNTLISAVPNPANVNLSFVWTGGPSTVNGASMNVSPSTTTSYSVAASYPGCLNKDSVVTVSVDPNPILQLSSTSVSCISPNGSISASASGNSPFTYTLQPSGSSQSSTTASFTGLSAGTYTVSVSSGLANCSATQTVVINSISGLTWNAQNTNMPSCAGAANGNISVSVSGGNGVYSYQIQPGAVSNTNGFFANVSANTYTITAQDGTGCTLTTALVINEPSPILISNLVIDSTTCKGDADGQIQIAASGGTGALSYNLLPGNITNSTGFFNLLVASNYTITISDANACSISTIVVVHEPDSVQWTALSVNDVLCNGDNNGWVTMGAQGGTGTPVFWLQPVNANNQSGSFSNLSQGVYTASAIDAKGCTISTAITINQPSQLQINNVSNTIPSCVPGNDASITMGATGGTPNYSYSINGGAGQSSGTFVGLGSGVYTIQVSDANSCTQTSTVSIVTPNAPSFNAASATNVLCNGGTSGSITSSASGGTGSLSYVLQPGAVSSTSGSYSGLQAGSYTITVTDGVGCTASTTLSISEPPVVTLSTNHTAILCNGGTSTITASGGGGTPSYQYQLNTGAFQASNTFSALAAGTYTITIRDANLCTQSTIVTINQPPVVTLSASNTAILCNGGTSTITAIGGGGTPNYQYQLNGGTLQSSTIFSGVTAGSYTITVQDANGCTQSTTLTINQPSQLQINNVSNTIPSCVPGNDASITMGATGGTPNYSYSINGGAGQSSGTFVGLGSGVYTIQVSDANGCSANSTVSIANPPLLTLLSSQSTPSVCNGQNSGSITIQAGGGTGLINYNLSPGSISNQTGSFSSLSAGSYNISATDQLGCSIVIQISVSQPPAVLFTSVVTDSTSCSSSADGNISVNAVGGVGSISYTLIPGGQTNTNGQFSGLTASNYTVIASDINGCSSSVALTIYSPITVVWGTVSSTSITCFGLSNGSINAPASGGSGSIIYQLQPGALSNVTGTFSGLAAGAYTITATDANNCFISTSVTLTQPTALTITSVSTTLESCSPTNDGTATVIATGGVPNYTYSYGVGPAQTSNVLQGLSSGTYTVTVSDGNNCSKTSLFLINSPAAHSWNTPLTNSVTCFGSQNGSISVSISNGINPLTYSIAPLGITNSNGSFSGLFAGNYTISVTDALNCTSSTIVSVTQPNALQIITATSSSPTCFGLINGNANYQASGGVGIIQYQLQPFGTTNTNGNFMNLGGGQYSVIATDANGCSVTSTFSLINPPAINILNVNVINTSCNPNNIGVISLTANGGTPPLQYSNNGSPFTSNAVFGGLVAGSYNVVVVDANNCSINTSVIISEPPPPAFNFLSVIDNKCYNETMGQIQIVATGQNSITNYQLNPGNVNSGIGYFSNLLGGTYNVLATDSKGCTVATAINLLNPSPLQFTEFLASNANCAEKFSARLITNAIGGTGVLKYTLTPSSASNISGDFTNLPPGSYTVSVSDQNNCSISDKATLTQEICCDKIFVPNAFTPNGDGKNDEFKMVNAFGIQLLDFSIVNRWGNIVFKSVSEEIGWNGRQNGVDCEIGTYYYLIKYRCLYSGQEYVLKGDISLIR